ncbi:uncharacterized protein PV09_01147 [Verruconis gallopava]|uniref:Dipeptidyl-peptidase V n=1 Tax=Verruconis gallopava TaxID=253628 RepID=A0A0D2BA84_9PEZI|nr:uncharacterized protein PV09_01147 [Verruconis gallopava]KIW08219.1 hypothetical protein PV09_01147 [Verruconis gallopava]
MAKLQAVAAVAAYAITAVHAMTPEQMLAAPRRSEAIPNPSGEWAAFTSTNYSFETHESQTVWNLLNLKSGEVSLLYEGSDISELVWIGPTNTSVIYVNGTNEEGNGGISLYSADVNAMEDATLLGSLPAPYSGLKAVKTASGDIHFLMYCQAYENGTAYNADLEEKPISTARIYTEIYVRHWDTWLTDKKNNIFAGTLKSGDNGYTFDGNMKNLMQGLGNLTRAESPVMPFGGSSDYDISPDGNVVAFLTKNIDLPLANYTSSQIWLVPFNGDSEPRVLNGLGAASTPPGAEGASSGPVFSPDSSMIAYLQMDEITYESDRNKIYVAKADAERPEIRVLCEDWDISPSVLHWNSNGTGLYLAAPHRGNDRIFEMIPLDAPVNFEPVNITDRGSVAAFYVLPDNNLLVSDSKMWSARDFYILSPSGELLADLFHANRVDPGYEGLDESIQSEFYFPGNFTDVHSFIVYPQNFDESKKYPLAFIIHGGPQSQHTNAFSTRWNFKVWADQGYVVIAPNPTGSNGFGEAFQDAIQNNWGSYPYDDLVKCWNYVKENFPYIDTDNGIAAGASYGGYMTNWIQGHDLGRKFKALVTHDGSTDTTAQYTTEELWFMQHDFNGTLWDNRENYERWNPINHIHNWATPQFVVHNTLDYRLPESEGIMLFNILQSRGVPSKFLSFPDENHWVLNRENSLVWHREIFKWINHYSGLSEEGPY